VTIDRQNSAKVGLHESADREPTEAFGQHPRGGTDPTLETKGAGPGARTHGALRNRAVVCLLDGEKNIEWSDRTGPDVVEVSVIRLADDRVDRSHLLVAGLSKRPVDHRLHHRSHAQGVGEDDRRFQIPQLLHLQQAGRLAEGIRREDRRRHFRLKDIAVVGHDRGHAGADALTLDQRPVAHPDANDIGDCVERSGLKHSGLDTEVADPRAWVLLGKGRKAADQAHKENERVAQDDPPNFPLTVSDITLARGLAARPNRR
jgi:hypothetical protein